MEAKIKRIKAKISDFTKNSKGEDWEYIGKIFKIWNLYIKDLEVIKNKRDKILKLPLKLPPKIPQNIKFNNIILNFNDYYYMVENNFLEIYKEPESIDEYFPFIGTERGFINFIFLMSVIYQNIDYYYIYEYEINKVSGGKFSIENFIPSMHSKKPLFIIYNEGNSHAVFYIYMNGKIFNFNSLDVNYSDYCLQSDLTSCRSISLYFLEYYSKLFYKNNCSEIKFFKLLENDMQQFNSFNINSDNILPFPKHFFKLIQSNKKQNKIIDRIDDKLDLLAVKIDRVIRQLNYNNNKDCEILKKDRDNYLSRKFLLEININKFRDYKSKYDKNINLIISEPIENINREIVNISSLSNRLKQTFILIEMIKSGIDISPYSFEENEMYDYSVVKFTLNKYIEISQRRYFYQFPKIVKQLFKTLKNQGNIKDINNCFILACKVGNVKLIREFFIKISNIGKYKIMLDDGFKVACKFGQLGVIEEFFKNKNIIDEGIVIAGFELATRRNRKDIIEEILKNSCIEDKSNILMKCFELAYLGYPKIIKIVAKNINLYPYKGEVKHWFKVISDDLKIDSIYQFIKNDKLRNIINLEDKQNKTVSNLLFNLLGRYSFGYYLYTNCNEVFRILLENGANFIDTGIKLDKLTYFNFIDGFREAIEINYHKEIKNEVEIYKELEYIKCKNTYLEEEEEEEEEPEFVNIDFERLNLILESIRIQVQKKENLVETSSLIVLEEKFENSSNEINNKLDKKEIIKFCQNK